MLSRWLSFETWLSECTATSYSFPSLIPAFKNDGRRKKITGSEQFFKWGIKRKKNSQSTTILIHCKKYDYE